MCPACLTTLALIPVGVGSAGGVAAVIVQKLRQKPADVSANKEDNR